MVEDRSISVERQSRSEKNSEIRANLARKAQHMASKGYSNKEISNLMDFPESTIRSLLKDKT